jgi:hypothetical protein
MKLVNRLRDIWDSITLIPAVILMIWWIKPWKKPKEGEREFYESGLDERE